MAPLNADGHRPKQVRGRRIASPEYRAWQAMKNRCYNQKTPDYPYYGGRDIFVCPQWRSSFDAFLRDMGPRPSAAHTLDRKNTNEGYHPKNCRWATRKIQSRNRNYCRLSEEKAREIRAQYSAGEITQAALATKFGVTQAHVSQIVRGTAWT